jgi:hypothetical protein
MGLLRFFHLDGLQRIQNSTREFTRRRRTLQIASERFTTSAHKVEAMYPSDKTLYVAVEIRFA